MRTGTEIKSDYSSFARCADCTYKIHTSSNYKHVMHSSSTVSIGNHFYAICNSASLRIAISSAFSCNHTMSHIVK